MYSTDALACMLWTIRKFLQTNHENVCMHEETFAARTSSSCFYLLPSGVFLYVLEFCVLFGCRVVEINSFSWTIIGNTDNNRNSHLHDCSLKTLHTVSWSSDTILLFVDTRHSLLHFQLSHMAVHHHLLHHLHHHHLHLFLLVQSFTLNLRLGSSANYFLHRPFPFLPDWFHGFLFCSTAGFVCMVC